MCRHGGAGLWWAAVPKSRWPTDAESLEFINKYWDPSVGDARQELVVIGIEADETALRRRLDHCLLTDAEMAMGPQAWETFYDPFPSWSGELAQTQDAD